MPGDTKSSFNKSHLSLVKPRENAQRALKPFNSIQITKLSDAKRIIERNAALYLQGLPVSFSELRAVEDFTIKSKRHAFSNSNETMALELDMLFIPLYSMVEAPEVVYGILNYCNQTYEDFKLSESADRVLEFMETKIGAKQELSDNENIQNYLAHAKKIYERSGQDNPYWAIVLNYATANRSAEEYQQSYNLYSQSECLINEQYTELDKRANPFLCLAEYGQGLSKFMASSNSEESYFVIDAIKKDNSNSQKQIKYFDDMKIAENKFLNVKRLGFEQSELYNCLGCICADKGNFEEALNNFADAVELNIKNVDPLINACRIFINFNQYDRAAAILDYVAMISPEDKYFKDAVTLYYEKTGVLLALAEESTLQESISKDELIASTVDSCMDIIRDTSWFKKHPDDAAKIEEAKHFIEKSYDFIMHGIRNESDSAEDFLAAEDLLLKSQKAHVLIDTHIAYFNLYYQMGFIELSIEAFEHIPFEFRDKLVKDPIAVEILKELNYYLQNPYQYIEHAEETAKKFPDHWGTYSTLGHAYLNAAEKEADSKKKIELLNKSYVYYIQAEKKLEKFLEEKESILGPEGRNEITPYMCRYLFGQGYSKFLEYCEGLKSNKESKICLAEATQKLAELYDIGYSNTDLSYALGVISYKYDDLEEATEFLEESIELNPRNIKAWLELGCINLEAGNFDTAVDYLKEAKAIDADNEDLKDILSEYRLELD